MAVSFLKRIRTHVRAAGLGSADLSQSGRIWPNLFHPPISLRLCVCSWRVRPGPPRWPPAGADAEMSLKSLLFESKYIIRRHAKLRLQSVPGRVLNVFHCLSDHSPMKILGLKNLPWTYSPWKTSTKFDFHPHFSIDPKMDLIVGPESVTISIKSCLRRRSGIFTHFTLQGTQTRRFAKQILFDELRARMTHRETFLNWLWNRASEYFPINGAVRNFSKLLMLQMQVERRSIKTCLANWSGKGILAFRGCWWIPHEVGSRLRPSSTARVTASPADSDKKCKWCFFRCQYVGSAFEPTVDSQQC